MEKTKKLKQRTSLDEEIYQRTSLGEEIYQRALKRGKKPWETEPWDAGCDLVLYENYVEYELEKEESLKGALEKRLYTFEKNNQKTKVLTENEGLKNHITELNKSIAMLKRKMEKWQHKKKMQELMREESKEQEYIKEALEKRLAALEKNDQKTKVLTENEGLKNHITELNKRIVKLKSKMEDFEWHPKNPKNPKKKMQELVLTLKGALEKRLYTFEKNNQKTKVLTENEGLKNHIAELNKSIAMLKRKMEKFKRHHRMKMQELMREKSKEQEYIKEALEKRLAALEKNDQKTKVLTENEGLKNHIAELNKQITEFKEQMRKIR